MKTHMAETWDSMDMAERTALIVMMRQETGESNIPAERIATHKTWDELGAVARNILLRMKEQRSADDL